MVGTECTFYHPTGVGATVLPPAVGEQQASCLPGWQGSESTIAALITGRQRL